MVGCRFDEVNVGADGVKEAFLVQLGGESCQSILEQTLLGALSAGDLIFAVGNTFFAAAILLPATGHIAGKFGVSAKVAEEEFMKLTLERDASGRNGFHLFRRNEHVNEFAESWFSKRFAGQHARR